MSWKQRAGVVALVLFTSLPGSETLCAMMCDSAAAAASTHHGADQNCQESARTSAAVQAKVAPDHDCSNHGAAIRQAASTVSERVELKAPSIVFALSDGRSSFSSRPRSAPAIVDASPPGAAPRTTTQVVLRV